MKGASGLSEKITYSYYTSALASQNAFFRLPRALYEKECFRGLSNDAKTLYALMLDRMSLSLANQWLDEDGKVYINYSLEDIMTTLNCGKTKAVALLKELDSESGIGLIEKKNMGIAKASVFYVMNFICEDETAEEKQGLDSSEERAGIVSAEEDLSNVDNSAPRVQKMNSEETCVFDNRTHACPENEHDRVQNLNGVEAFEALVAKADEYELADLEKEIKVIFADARANFTAKEAPKTRIPYNTIDSKTAEEYGGLYEKYGIKPTK